MSDIAAQALQVQITAWIVSWQREIADNRHLNTGYRQGYADALDRCVQALRLLLKETT